MVSSAFPERREAHTLARRSTGGPSQLALGVLALLFLVACALRVCGDDFMLPHVPQVDEQVLVLQANAQRGGDVPESKRNIPYAYPTLLARGLVWAAPDASERPCTSLEEHLEAASADIVHYRSVLALLSSLAIPLTFFVCRRFTRDSVALLASAWMTFSVLHGWYASQARPHAVLSVVTLIAVLACLALRRLPRWTTYLAAGAAVGVAFGALQSGLFTLAALVAAHLLRDRSRAEPRERASARGPEASRESSQAPSRDPSRASSHSTPETSPSEVASSTRRWTEHVPFAASLSLAFGVALLFYEHGYAVAPGEEEVGVLEQILHRSHGLTLEYVSGRGFAAMTRAVADYEPWLGAWAVIGTAFVVAGFVSRRRTRARLVAVPRPSTIESRPTGTFVIDGRDACVVAAHAGAHLLAFGLFSSTFQRFLMPVMPYACMLAAVGTARSANWMASGFRRASTRTGGDRADTERVGRVSATRAVVVLAVLAPQSYVAAKLTWLKVAPDTCTLAADWLRAHADRTRDTIVAMPTFDLPLLRTRAGISANLAGDRLAFYRWIDHHLLLSDEELAPIAYRLSSAPLQSAADRRRLTEDPRGFVKALGARYVVAEVMHGGRRPIAEVFRAAVASEGRVVARFGPLEDPRDDDWPILYQFDGPIAPERGFAWRAARSVRQGPDLEIYELPLCTSATSAAIDGVGHSDATPTVR